MNLFLLATFAGGCFWCMQPPFDNVPGVIRTTVGYMGGPAATATYDHVSTGQSGHSEVIQIEYDPKKVSYETLLSIYWKNVDPTDEYGQFADLGPQYSPIIFVHDEAQRKAAEASKVALANAKKFNKPIVVRIKSAGVFYPGESYHQGYYKSQPTRYERYKVGSGRAGFLKKTWGAVQD